MTRDEMLLFLVNNPHVRITHFLFEDSEYIYSANNGMIYDENNYLFEDWDSLSDRWSGRNGIRMRSGGQWEDGWSVK